MSREGRRGGRAARRSERTSFGIRALPPLERRIPVYELLDGEAEERIHEAAMRILEETGIDFHYDRALDLWRRAGARVDGQRVRLDRGLLLELVAKAPERFRIRARNPERDLEIGGSHTVFFPTYGSPFVRMFDGERRYGTLADLEQFHRLASMSPAIHATGSITCEPVDIPVPKRHLHVTASAIRNSDKVFMGPVTAPERAEDAVRMAALLFGEEVARNEPVMVSLVNCNSPLVWDETMLGALDVYAQNNQPVIVSPFTMAGANTPASPAATVAQLVAEALAGIAFTQLVRPGCPMILGNFLSAVSMKSGAPMAGTSELALMNFMIGQMARRYRLPWRSSGMLTGSKIVDAQAGYESAFNMLPILLAGCHLVMHTAGWTEAGLTANIAKFALDAEQMEMLWRLGRGVPFDDFDEALATIAEIGPAGHFFGTTHTQAHFRDAFFMAELFDNNSFEQWQLEGEKDAAARGLEAARRMLDSFEAPPLDPGIAEAIADYVARRERELPDSAV